MPEEKEVAPETNGQAKEENNDNAEEASDLETAIIRQVEYYFGDMNIPRDKFMRDQLSLDDGWVPLDILMKFNRLQKLTPDPEVVAKAIQKSTSGLLEVSEDCKKIRRNPELPFPELNEERRKEILQRTVYAKGFNKDASLDDLLKYFKAFETTENVIMRKYVDKNTKNKMFKGSVFVTFQTKEQAEKFLNTKGLKYNETDLLIMPQADYLKMKQEEYTAKRDQRDKKTKKQADKEEEKDEFKLPKGTVLHFKNASNKTKREDVKDALTEIGGEVAYVDFKLGDTQGWVRFGAENAAKDIMEKIPEGKLTIGESEIEFRLIEGDEEKEFLDKTAEEMIKRRKNMKNVKHNKGKLGHFKGRQGRKRRHEDNDGIASKKVRDDS